MYTPKLFARQELEELLPLMQEAPFATVITIVDEAPLVSHLPLLAGGKSSPARSRSSRSDFLAVTRS